MKIAKRKKIYVFNYNDLRIILIKQCFLSMKNVFYRII